MQAKIRIARPCSNLRPQGIELPGGEAHLRIVETFDGNPRSLADFSRINGEAGSIVEQNMDQRDRDGRFWFHQR